MSGTNQESHHPQAGALSALLLARLITHATESEVHLSEPLISVGLEAEEAVCIAQGH